MHWQLELHRLIIFYCATQTKILKLVYNSFPHSAYHQDHELFGVQSPVEPSLPRATSDCGREPSGIQSDIQNEGQPKVKRRCRRLNPLSELQDPEQFQTAFTSLQMM